MKGFTLQTKIREAGISQGEIARRMGLHDTQLSIILHEDQVGAARTKQVLTALEQAIRDRAAAILTASGTDAG